MQNLMAIYMVVDSEGQLLDKEIMDPISQTDVSNDATKNVP